MEKIEKESLLPRYHQLAQILSSEIKKMSPGARLPSVQQLKKEYGLSQATIDKALSELARKGLVVPEKGKGIFVKDVKAAKEILWVCGLDVFNDDISPYYTRSLQCCAAELEKAGYRLVPQVWESKRRKPYDSSEYNEYSGIIFIACDAGHPLLKHAKANKMPYIHMTCELLSSNAITNDFAQGMTLAAEYFRSHAGRGKGVTVIGDERYGAEIESIRKTLFPKADLKFIGVPVSSAKIREVAKAGYESAKAAFAGKPLPASLLVMDDILAIGVANAVLEFPYGQLEKMSLLVRGSGQIPIPFPRPISYLSISPEDEARAAVRMLLARIAKKDGVEGGSLKYSILEGMSIGSRAHDDERLSK